MQDQELKDIQIVTEVLKKGGICIIPTEIGYEIVCDGTNETPVSKLFSCFSTASKSQFSLLVNHINQLSRYTRELPEVAEELLGVATSPLTLILPTVSGISQSILIDKDKAPFRIVSVGLIDKILERINRPLLSIPATDNLDKIPTSAEYIPQPILAIADHTAAATKQAIFTAKMPSVIELGLNGSVKIIND
ncbi:Sua5/YciO/YrdC/YwlC family protein [uncultured Acetobacteroides sp.]|uniref:L-threonylcarbamoyladenylate synthase n=1 Tax=uncultured Acetobacteroides sp. TaxID=1760811 RepID=UPI0029F51E75|nr:Sua5/YciO/YrdC/YwlC family protein [uncultured Acetobacteroides sp.]